MHLHRNLFIFATTKKTIMELNKLIKMQAESYASFGNEDDMSGEAYFAFVAGAKYALELISKQINDEL